MPHMVSEIEEKVTMVACGGFHTAAVTQCGKVKKHQQDLCINYDY